MDLFKKLIDLIFYFERDKAAGKPYWQDPALIGLVLSFACTELAKLYGLHVDADLQLKIVGVVTGIGALLSPHTGVVAKPYTVADARKVAAQVQERNRTDPTTSIDHGAS
jgi:uncharacterized membrane protein